jgi:DNA-binding transcriptional LysR family regulator
MAQHHRLAERLELDFAELLDEPFLALPESAGQLRDYWLAMDQRGGRPAVIGAIINTPDETYEAIVDGRGICLLAAGNAPSVARGDVITRPVHGVPQSTLALAWRKGDGNPLIRAYAHAAAQAVRRVDRL